MDDYAVVREGLKQILAESIPEAVFDEADTGEEALEKARNRAWDVVILDMSLPGRSGIDVLKELRRTHPRLPVLVLSMHPEEQFAVRALKAGAAGYVTKRTAARHIAAAVRKVLAGGKYVSASLAEKLVAELGTGAEAPHERLSDREFQVFRSLAMAKTVKQISGEMSISRQSVSTYRSRVLEKMGLTTNDELTEYALQNGLLK
ncbi:MAG: response regulator transcription factor [Thermoanaerobaculia bacterium]